MTKKAKSILAISIVCVLVVTGGVLGWVFWPRDNALTITQIRAAINTAYLDMRNEDISLVTPTSFSANAMSIQRTNANNVTYGDVDLYFGIAWVLVHAPTITQNVVYTDTFNGSIGGITDNHNWTLDAIRFYEINNIIYVNLIISNNDTTTYMRIALDYNFSSNNYINEITMRDVTNGTTRHRNIRIERTNNVITGTQNTTNNDNILDTMFTQNQLTNATNFDGLVDMFNRFAQTNTIGAITHMSNVVGGSMSPTIPDGSNVLLINVDDSFVPMVEKIIVFNHHHFGPSISRITAINTYTNMFSFSGDNPDPNWQFTGTAPIDSILSLFLAVIHSG